MGFKKAVKYNAKLRMAIAGPAGSGKTWTALTIAKGLAGGGPIALIDTEHDSASKYADEFEFDSQGLTNFDPRNYIKAIHEAENDGYAVLIIDSLSHAWNGTGGALELVEATAKRGAAQRNKKDPNTFNAWGEVTPIQNQLIDAIVGSKIHIICTMRTKTEYVVEGNSPRKLGMAPIQRADMEYEFDVYADMNIDNTMIIQKSRCRALSGAVIPKPTIKVADVLKEWLAGPDAPVIAETPVSLIRKRVADIKVMVDGKALSFEDFYKGIFKREFESDDAITPNECTEMSRRLDAVLQARTNAKAAKEQQAS
jgi:AAA domain